MDIYKKAGLAAAVAICAASAISLQGRNIPREEYVRRYTINVPVYRVSITSSDRMDDWLNGEGRPVGRMTAREIFRRFNSTDDFIAGRVAYLPDLKQDGKIMGRKLSPMQKLSDAELSRLAYMLR